MVRVKIVRAVLIFGFSLLSLGIFYTQIIKGPTFARLAESNRVRLVPIEGVRGVIYDRNGEVLAGNRISFDVVAIPQELRRMNETFAKLSGFLSVPESFLIERFKENYIAPFAPVYLARDITKEKAILIESERIFLPGVMIQTRPLRDYPHGRVASHLLGYLGEIDKEELRRLSDYGYRRKDQVGRSGVERFYDSYLRADCGGMQIEVDNRGRMVRTLGIEEPQAGMDVQLTIDLRVQGFLDEALAGRVGCAIAIDSRTGEVLALASSPGFDPNIFVKFGQRDKIRGLLKDSGRPLLNRAISGLYPPGSTFKAVTSAAGLEAQKITFRNEFFCPGHYQYGDRIFRCWNDEGHGSVNLKGALVNSCNVFFYNVARLTGPDSIANAAWIFGIGRRTNIDLPGESSGLLPSKKWKKARLSQAWSAGDTLNFGIGQGYLMVTPLQMLCAINAVANGGYSVTPVVVKKIGGVEVSSAKQKRIPVSAKTLAAIKEGMDAVVEDPGGTGARARVEGIKIGAKTGTAQTPKGAAHGWFIGYAPSDSPMVSFVVFLEYGGSGGGVPAQIVHGFVSKLRECKII